MTELDEKGLAAAREHAQSIDWISDDETLSEAEDSNRQLSGIIRAYLAATRTSDALRDLQRMGQECERKADRLAVVTNGLGQSTARYMHDGWQDDRDWGCVHAQAEYYGFHAPFARAIVECRLPRPSEPAAVKGKATNV